MSIMESNVFHIEPIYLEKIWGKQIDDKKIGEVIKFGINEFQSNRISSNKTLYNLYSDIGQRKNIFGKKYLKKEKFPFLIKNIYAKERLSLQVHSKFKNEVWFFLPQTNKSKIILGLKNKIDNFHIETILNNCNYIEVNSSNFVIVDPRTIHSIMENNEVCEIQDNENVTLRFYDWGRNRKLHYEEAIKILNNVKLNISRKFKKKLHSYKTRNFKVVHYFIKNNKQFGIKGFCRILVIIDGSGTIISDNMNTTIEKDNCYLVSANKPFSIIGDVEMLLIY